VRSQTEFGNEEDDEEPLQGRGVLVVLPNLDGFKPSTWLAGCSDLKSTD
jgi:hypothetical protein